MNTAQPAYYRALPENLRWEGVRILNRAQLRRILPREADIVTDCSKISFPDFKIFGPEAKIRSEQPSADEALLLHDLARTSSQLQTDFVIYAFSRAGKDYTNYMALSRSFAPNMVEQSLALVLGRSPFTGTITAGEVTIQPRVKGTSLSQMIPWYSKMMFMPDILERYRQTFLNIAAEFKELIGSNLTDKSPDNFIITPEGHLVYVNYRTVTGGTISLEYAVSLLEKFGPR